MDTNNNALSFRRSSPKIKEANLHIHIRKYITQTNSSIHTNTSTREMKTSNRHQTQQKDNSHADQ